METTDKWNKLQAEFDTYEEQAPEGLCWEGISSGLRRNRRRKAIRWTAGASAAFACAAAALILTLSPRGKTEVDLIRQEPHSRLAEADVRPKPAGDNGSTTTPGAKTPQVRPIRISPESIESSSVASANSASQSYSATAEGLEPSVWSEAGIPPEETAENHSSGKEESVERIDVDASGKDEECEIPGENFAGFAEEGEGREVRRRRASLRLSLSNGSPYSTVQGGYGAMNSSAVTYQLSSASGLTTAGLSTVLLRNNDKEVSTSTTHYQPLKFELLAGVEVLRSLSVVSGVSYSCLISDLTSGTDTDNYETRQTLHYIGIPLALSYNIPLADRLGLYLTLGGRIEQNICGTSSTAYMSGGRVNERQTSSLTEKVPQWSAFAGLGLQWRLSGSMHVFAEPSVNYCFDNGSHVETIYKERPLNFNLSLGLKFDL